MNEKIKKLLNIIKSSNNICVFTGAGISVASGIPDFRSSNGLYNKSGYNYPPEQIISHTFFEKHTELFYDFYKNNMIFRNAKPNLAHLYFYELERNGKNINIVTQNIDGLHLLAGNKNVFEIHGSVFKNYCTKCGKKHNIDRIINTNDIPKCECGGIIKPDVVLYEESLDDEIVNGAINAIKNADAVIVIGTSLVVYPAASFLRYYNGNSLVLINKSSTSYDDIANLTINDDIINVIKELKDIK